MTRVEADMAKLIKRWRKAGTRVFIGDPGRAFQDVECTTPADKPGDPVAAFSQKETKGEAG